MSEEREKKTAKGKLSEGIKQGIGILSAFKDALEETIQEARERGDLSADRAKEVMKSALGKAQDAAGSARERLDFVTQSEFAGLESVVTEIRDRVSELEARVLGRSDEGGEEHGDTSDDPGEADAPEAS